MNNVVLTRHLSPRDTFRITNFTLSSVCVPCASRSTLQTLRMLGLMGIASAIFISLKTILMMEIKTTATSSRFQLNTHTQTSYNTLGSLNNSRAKRNKEINFLLSPMCYLILMNLSTPNATSFSRTSTTRMAVNT